MSAGPISRAGRDRSAADAAPHGPPCATICVRYARTAAVPTAAFAALPRTDRDRLASRTLERRRAEHLAGRALLRATLAERSERDYEIRSARGGHLECADGPSVSVSHSAGWTACALGFDRTVGIDVEQPRPHRQVEAIARHHFTRAESEWVAAQPVPRFYMLWVLKEAYLKALGVGLAGGLDALECRIDGDAIEAAASGAVPALRLYALEDAYLAVAWLGGPCESLDARSADFARPVGARLELLATTVW